MLPKLKHNFRALKNIFFGVLLLTLSGCVMDIRDYVGSGRGILGVSGKKTKKYDRNRGCAKCLGDVLGTSWAFF